MGLFQATHHSLHKQLWAVRSGRRGCPKLAWADRCKVREVRAARRTHTLVSAPWSSQIDPSTGGNPAHGSSCSVEERPGVSGFSSTARRCSNPSSSVTRTGSVEPAAVSADDRPQQQKQNCLQKKTMLLLHPFLCCSTWLLASEAAKEFGGRRKQNFEWKMEEKKNNNNNIWRSHQGSYS